MTLFEQLKSQNNRMFTNAESAFIHYYEQINKYGVDFDNTKALFNISFYIYNPLDNHINVPFRKWKKDYAEYEWMWYLSKDPSAIEIAKRAKIWNNMMDPLGNVNSNYGWQWSRNNQLDKVIELLKKKDTRKACISIYDGKEIDTYTYDTPCTNAINFYILENRLQMSVIMRSNDLYFGFCNDQYCFSNLQKSVADSLGIEVGYYYHYATNLHLYTNHLNLQK